MSTRKPHQKAEDHGCGRFAHRPRTIVSHAVWLVDALIGRLLVFNFCSVVAMPIGPAILLNVDGRDSVRSRPCAYELSITKTFSNVTA